jgi:hypothetical protein
MVQLGAYIFIIVISSSWTNLLSFYNELLCIFLIVFNSLYFLFSLFLIVMLGVYCCIYKSS